MIKIVFSDFDGTLTHGHELRSSFFEVLNECKRLNAELVITTGRSLSWGHYFLTHFPMQFAILEGGGIICKKTNGDKEIVEVPLVSNFEQQNLKKVTEKLLDNFPGLNLSVDSYGRKTDRAIEYFKDLEQKEKVEQFLTAHRVSFSSSNVHLNFWPGEVTKFKAIEYVLKNYFQDVKLEETIYFGDSLNDQSAFKDHPNSVGVSNIASYLHKMIHRPKKVLEGPENESSFGVLNELRKLPQS